MKDAVTDRRYEAPVLAHRGETGMLPGAIVKGLRQRTAAGGEDGKCGRWQGGHEPASNRSGRISIIGMPVMREMAATCRAGTRSHLPGADLDTPRAAASLAAPPAATTACWAAACRLSARSGAMGQDVEESSTSCKANRRDHLNSLVVRFSAQSRAMTDAHHKLEVGERLRQAREALGYSQAEFARLHGVDKTKLSHWERGQHYPSPAFVLLLWERHRVTADWIYLGQIHSLPYDLGVSLRAGVAGSPAAP